MHILTCSSFFVFSCSDFSYLLIVVLEGFCCTWSHSVGHMHSVVLLWTRDRPAAEISTWQHKTLATNIHAPAAFESIVSASEWPQTHALIGAAVIYIYIYIYILVYKTDRPSQLTLNFCFVFGRFRFQISMRILSVLILDFSLFYSVSPHNFRSSALNYATAASFRII